MAVFQGVNILSFGRWLAVQSTCHQNIRISLNDRMFRRYFSQLCAALTNMHRRLSRRFKFGAGCGTVNGPQLRGRAPAMEGLKSLDLADFKALVAAAFRQEGYLVVERSGGAADACIDLEMYLGRDRYLVYCQQWQEPLVGIGLVRQLSSLMRVERALGCFIVTTGAFSCEARSVATGRAIRLVPAESLCRLLLDQHPLDDDGRQRQAA